MAGDPLESIYALAIRAAAAREAAIDAATALQVERDLTAFALALVKGIETLPLARQLALRRAAAIVQAAAEELDRALITGISTGRQVVFRDTFQILARAQRAAAQSLDIPLAELGAIPIPRLGDAHAFTAVAELYDFRTLVRGHVVAGAKDALSVIRAGIVQGTKPDAIARAIRPYILGAEAIPGGVADLRKVPAAYKGAAQQLAYNAKRIAYSETHAARMLSQAVRMRDDPFVIGGKWHTAPNRGKVRIPDICVTGDTLITTADGHRRAVDIRLGDLLLTHVGRYRPVTRLYRRTIQDGPLLLLRCQAERSRTLDLRLTPNHPVLTDRGWMPAGDLRTGMRVALPPSLRTGLGDRRPCDNQCTAAASSAGSAPSPVSGIAGLRRCDAPPRPEHRTTCSDRRDDRAPTLPRTTGSGTRSRLVRAIAGSLAQFAPLRAALARRRCAETRLDVASRDSGSPRPAAPLRTPAPCSAGCSSDTGRLAAEQSTARTTAPRADQGASCGAPRTGASKTERASRDSVSLKTMNRSARTRPEPASPQPLPCTGDHSIAAGPRVCASGPTPPRTADSVFASEEYSDTAPVGQYAIVVDIIERRAVDVPVFNFEVADDHTYVAGGLVVHNCDVLRDADFFGMGPGVYPSGHIPPPPHPWDRCFLIVVPRTLKAGEDWRAPKPAPDSYRLMIDPAHDPLPHVDEMTPAAQLRVRRDLAQLLGA